MVTAVNSSGHIDIHNYQQRLERAVRFLKKHPEVTEENKAQILKFLEHIKAENLSLARQVSYVQWMTTIAANLGRKSFTQTKKQDVEALLAKFNGKAWSEATKENYQEAVKKFWRWLRGLPRGEDPEETEWVKVGGAKGRKIIPEELLTAEEANDIIAAAEHPRDKAYAAVTDESGARPEEILSAKIRQVQFDQYGAVFIVNGKVGYRRIRLIKSAPLLARWLDTHPNRNDPNAPLWVNVGSTRHGGAFDYNAARKVLRELGRKAGVRKRIYPYLFRHSTATRLANLLAEAQMCLYFGWRQGSRMPSFYVHLSGRDVDNKMLELYGLKPKENGFKDQIQICQRCQANNSPVSKFCNRCGSALDLKTALEDL